MSQMEMMASTLSLSNSKEPHITIIADRTISVPDSLKQIAVQYDHNIETVTFDCPRYWDDIDMSEFRIFINYRRPDGELGTYEATNLQIYDDILQFDWVISEHVTLIKGQLAFSVCIINPSENVGGKKHWNSNICTDMYISEGLEVLDPTIPEYPDLFNQFLNQVETLLNNTYSKQEIDAKFDDVNTTIGGIETALDELHAYAQSLAGGDTA